MNSHKIKNIVQLLQPTHDESVKDNDKIEGETLKKLIHHNFRSKTLVPVKTDYEAANIKVVWANSNRNYYSAQDVIKNIESIKSYNNVINPVYLIHGTHVAIKLNTQTDITECREAITELVLNNTDKFSRRSPSDSVSNTGETLVPVKTDYQAANFLCDYLTQYDSVKPKADVIYIILSKNILLEDV
ncbi:hypothetical protein ACTFIR_009429 [Dictyostelium discoideum]